mmetsp:Transcript_24053/g.66658  ORF Transcript_24053/g.66658 Transcript_24053/m.66658 type:complete len:337 (-) Transcript_24053:67-1077(-)
MNISLTNAVGNKSKKKGSASLTLGLNNRNGNGSVGKPNVFGDGGDSSDSDHDMGIAQNKSRREIVNEQIAREQAARRRRAQADLASVKDQTVFDYDGAYDSFQTTPNAPKTEGEKRDSEKKSKYIGDLLKAAKVRERERDAIFERRNAREQAEEDAKDEYKGKEKFVTNSYKRKLQERKQWEAKQEEKDRIDEANDVTKKSAGTAFAGFYGNLTRSVLTEQKGDYDESVVSGENRIKNSDTTKGKNDNIQSIPDDDFNPRQGFLGGFERSSASNGNGDTKHDGKDANSKDTEQASNQNIDDVPYMTKESLREIRERKVAEARKRYLKRKQTLISDQ